MRMMIATAALAAALSLNSAAYAAVAYDFETGLDGFGPNGLGVTISADTIGATNGPTSMKYSVVSGATFVGALTGTVPAPVNDPPGVSSVVFDLTVTDQFAGAFAALGVTIFGATQPDFPGGQLFGLQAQFADFASLETYAPGTYEVTLDLASAVHPVTFVGGQSFNDIFGGFGTGPNDLIPTGFQFFFNKSADAPATFYIDNVRVIPEPASLGLLALGLMGGLGIRRR